jgi:integrase
MPATSTRGQSGFQREAPSVHEEVSPTSEEAIWGKKVVMLLCPGWRMPKPPERRPEQMSATQKFRNGRPDTIRSKGLEKPMAIYKRGRIYWYKFMWNGEMVRESTRQPNQNTARQIEAAHRSSLAKGEVGIREKKIAQTLAEFISKRFEPWAETSTSPKTWLDYYRPGVRTIQSYKPLANLRLNEITSERVADFAAWRQSAGLQVSSVNSSLQVLRRILRLAVQWGAVEIAPLVKMLPGERHREHVVKPDEEARYLAAATEPLASVAAVLTDTGMRPDECYRLRWESVTWSNGRNGNILVTHGKTDAARRVLPLTARARSILQSRWVAVGSPSTGWVWSALTRSGHFEKSTLKKQHKKALRLSGVRPFVLYSLRHTFLTRLGESGCDAWTLARIAGHTSVAMSARYVHPSEDVVLAALDRLSGHSFGHSGCSGDKRPDTESPVSSSDDLIKIGRGERI